MTSDTSRMMGCLAIKKMMPFLNAIWASEPERFVFDFSDGKINPEQAKVELNEILMQAREDLHTLYDHEIVAYIRTPSSVREYLSNWFPLLNEARELMEMRHGVDRTAQLLPVQLLETK